MSEYTIATVTVTLWWRVTSIQGKDEWKHKALVKERGFVKIMRDNCRWPREIETKRVTVDVAPVDGPKDWEGYDCRSLRIMVRPLERAWAELDTLFLGSTPRVEIVGYTEELHMGGVTKSHDAADAGWLFLPAEYSAAFGKLAQIEITDWETYNEQKDQAEATAQADEIEKAQEA